MGILVRRTRYLRMNRFRHQLVCDGLIPDFSTRNRTAYTIIFHPFRDLDNGCDLKGKRFQLLPKTVKWVPSIVRCTLRPVRIRGIGVETKRRRGLLITTLRREQSRVRRPLDRIWGPEAHEMILVSKFRDLAESVHRNPIEVLELRRKDQAIADFDHTFDNCSGWIRRICLLQQINGFVHPTYLQHANAYR